MIKLNKYLKEIGIDENNWLFCEHDDPRYQEDEEGFKHAEFFDLDYSLSLYIYSHLCYFKEYCLVGHPANMTFEKWQEILDSMIEAFKLLITQDDTYGFEHDRHTRNNLSKNRRKKINYGLKMFTKYYSHLWY